MNGFYQGWDLHPAQLPTRYAAVYAFFLEGLDAASDRLTNFVTKAAQATLVGEVFDDAATGQGLLNYFLRAMNCGAITEREAVEQSGLTRRRTAQPVVLDDHDGEADAVRPVRDSRAQSAVRDGRAQSARMRSHGHRSARNARSV